MDAPTHVEITARIVNRWGNVEDVYAGSQPIWAWDDKGQLDGWKKVIRKTLLAERTSDPRGWRVSFIAGGRY